MKILILSDSLNPPSYIPRIRYIISYLAQRGDKITLCSELSDYKGDNDEVNYNFFEYIGNGGGLWAKIEWLLKTTLNLFCDHKGYDFFRHINKTLANQQFDAIFCTNTFHSFPITTANRISKQRQIPLYIDLRDIIEQTPANSDSIFRHRLPTPLGNIITWIYKRTHIKRRNKVLPNAKAITTVSLWHRDFIKNYNANTYVVYNGFDESLFIPQKKVSDHFIISYIGGIYDLNMSCPDMFFEAIKSLKDKHHCITKDIKIEWFTDRKSKKLLKQRASEFDIDNLMTYRDFVYGKKVVEKMNESSILLVLSHKASSDEYNGIMPTKFFEAIGVNRPILITPHNDNELTHTLNTINGGLASSNSDEIEQFILEKYDEWLSNGSVLGQIEDRVIQIFSRRDSAEITRKILEK